jgi:hypothetical protein
LPHWRGWLKPENRCLVPPNSFAEYVPVLNPETKKKDVVWFALNEDRPLFAFAGIWAEYRGDRGTKSKPIPGLHLVYGFRTSVPNAIVVPIHPNGDAGEAAGALGTRHSPRLLPERRLAVVTNIEVGCGHATLSCAQGIAGRPRGWCPACRNIEVLRY